MALAHFFLNDQIIADETSEIFPLKLSPDDVLHAHVLRLKKGEHIAVIDAAQDYFECEIVSYENELPLVRIAVRVDSPQENYQILLIQGLAKGNKMDEVVRHTTEVGISGFIPLICERSVVKLDEKKAHDRRCRWQTIAKNAAMQAGRFVVPEVSKPLTVEQACKSLQDVTAVFICWEEADQTDDLHSSLQTLFNNIPFSSENSRIAIVIGPEGGLSKNEVDLFLSCNPRSHIITLGNSILRTETAAVVACALVLYELRGLNNNAQAYVGGVRT